MEKKLTIRIKQELLDKYKILCDEKGYCLSKRIRNFIESELKNKKNKDDINERS